MKNEPVLTVAGIQAAVAAVLGLLVAFGVELNADQQTAIIGVAAIVLPLAFAVWARSKVTPAP